MGMSIGYPWGLAFIFVSSYLFLFQQNPYYIAIFCIRPSMCLINCSSFFMSVQSLVWQCSAMVHPITTTIICKYGQKSSISCCQVYSKQWNNSRAHYFLRWSGEEIQLITISPAHHSTPIACRAVRACHLAWWQVIPLALFRLEFYTVLQMRAQFEGIRFYV